MHSAALLPHLCRKQPRQSSVAHCKTLSISKHGPFRLSLQHNRACKQYQMQAMWPDLSMTARAGSSWPQRSPVIGLDVEGPEAALLQPLQNVQHLPCGWLVHVIIRCLISSAPPVMELHLRMSQCLCSLI